LCCMYNRDMMHARYDVLFDDEPGRPYDGGPDVDRRLRDGVIEVLSKRGLTAPGSEREQVGFAISDGPMIARGVSPCCSVALVGDGLGALTHYKSMLKPEEEPDCLPENYLPPIIRDLRDRGLKGLSAAVVGGRKIHYEGIFDVLNSERIPVVGRYSDSLRERGPDGWDLKTVAYFPGSREVLVKAMRSGMLGLGSEMRNHFKQLSPKTIISNMGFL
jgi:hypothetical protein